MGETEEGPDDQEAQICCWGRLQLSIVILSIFLMWNIENLQKQKRCRCTNTSLVKLFKNICSPVPF